MVSTARCPWVGSSSWISRSAVAAHDSDHGSYRFVEQLPVNRVEFLQGFLLLSRPDRELVLLDSLGDVEELGDGEGHGTSILQWSSSTVTNCRVLSPAFSRSWIIGSAADCSRYWVSPTSYRRTLRVPSGKRCRPMPPAVTVQK